VRIVDAVMKIERRIERLAERTDVPLQPIELRRRVLDEVEALIEPAGRGRRVLPFNWIGLTVAASDARRRAAIEAVLDDAGGLQRAIEARVAEAGCAVPAAFSIEVSFVDELPASPGGGRDWALVCERRTPGVARSRPAAVGGAAASDPSAAGAPHAAAATSARLVVLKGDAEEPVVAFAGERLNVGRLAEVLDRDHRVVRRNQLVFAESESPVNQTVSRAQAHIRLTPSGEYRLHDDHSTYGTRVFRAGRTLEIPSGSPRGLRLQPGDEIYFGRACARFELGPEPAE